MAGHGNAARYALGVFLIVPLGDMLNRRRLIPAMPLLSAVALAACAAAPTFAALLGAIAVLGVTTVSGQIIVPLAGDWPMTLNADGSSAPSPLAC